MATATLRPAGDGNYDGNWTLTGGTAGQAYTTIDEASTDDTDYISNNDTSSPYDKQSVTLDAMPAAASISSVIISYRGRSAFTTTPLIPFYRLSGADTEAAGDTLSTTVTQFDWDVTADRGWTTSDLSSLEIGWRRNSISSNTVRVTQAWVTVTYAPPAGIPPGLLTRPLRTVTRLTVRRV